MQAFIVNMEKDIKRKEYVSSVLSPYSNIKSVFIKAVDGRQLNDSEKDLVFDSNLFRQEYNRSVLPGEIGCTLSHQNIYNEIIKHKIKSALIFEDDIIIKDNFSELLPKIERLLNTSVPTIILLSGWFWFSRSRSLDKSHKLAKVVDGYLTHAYAINNTAAKLMLSKRPYLLADAWEKYRKFGIEIYGITPHLIDQDWTNFKSSISDNTRGLKSHTLLQWLKIKRRTILQKFLYCVGKFEPKSINSRCN